MLSGLILAFVLVAPDAATRALPGRPLSSTALLLGVADSPSEKDREKPLAPADAIKKVNDKVVVLMRVKAAKDRLEKRGEIYLDSEENFRDENNLGIVITKKGAAKFKDAGIADPADHFLGEMIRVRGVVTIQMNRPRIEVDDPAQIRLVE